MLGTLNRAGSPEVVYLPSVVDGPVVVGPVVVVEPVVVGPVVVD